MRGFDFATGRTGAMQRINFITRAGLIPFLALCLLLASFASQAVEISVYPPVPRPGSVIRLEVSGTWPNSCVPELDHATVSHGRFKVFAKALGIDCQNQPTPFHLETLLGHWIYTLMAVSGFYPVEFYVQTQPEAPPHLYAFNVIRADRDSDVRLLPENGFWWVDEDGLYGQAGRGSGLSIDRQGDKMIVTIQSYTADGQPVWYFAEGMVKNGVFRADYHQIAGGSPLYAVGNSPRQVHKVGHLILTFDNQRQGTLWLLPDFVHLPEQGIAVFPVSIRRYLTSGSTPSEMLQGTWLLAGTTDTTDDGRPEPRQLVFGQGRFLKDAKVQGQGKTLLMEFVAADKRVLRCQSGADKSLRQCTLLSPLGKALAIFDDVGVDRLRGRWLASGQPVSLMRVE